jgi:predicted enzyme related to lactoylglutathione lyase
MNPSFMLHTRDVEGMIQFYVALGFVHKLTGRSGNWTELTWGNFTLSLHKHQGELPPTGRLSIGFEAEDLEASVQTLSRAGLNPPAIVDESFGRILHLTDPDGNELFITQSEPELYA